MPDQPVSGGRQLIIEWITQLWPSGSRARPAGRSYATGLGGPQATRARISSYGRRPGLTISFG